MKRPRLTHELLARHPELAAELASRRRGRPPRPKVGQFKAKLFAAFYDHKVRQLARQIRASKEHCPGGPLAEARNRTAADLGFDGEEAGEALRAFINRHRGPRKPRKKIVR